MKTQRKVTQKFADALDSISFTKLLIGGALFCYAWGFIIDVVFHR